MLRLLSLLLVLAGVAGCARPSADAAAGRLRVVATTNLVADLARQIGGDAVAVDALMGPGVDPHLYRATEGDAQRLASADLVLSNGLHLEGKMGDVLSRLGSRSVAVAEAIPASDLVAPPAFGGNPDPHVWMDVRLWTHAARRTADALATADPAHADGYRARLAETLVRMDSLDAQVRRVLAAVPEGQRVLITAHDAFGYFGRAYGFDVEGLQGISTATEAGTADVAALAARVARDRIPALFVETSISPRSIEAVRAAVRARGHNVAIGGSLYSDALGGPGSGADTYETMLLTNARTIAGALKGSRLEGSRLEG